MTTIVYDRRTRTIVADSQNTDQSGAIWRMNKIERLDDGSFFLGSGHCYTIASAKNWARKGFEEKHRPDFTFFLEDEDDRGFSCLWISKDGRKVILIDGEMAPTEVLDDYMAVGSGAAYAMGALDAGKTAKEAVEVACQRDTSTSAPIHTYQFEGE